MKLVKFNYEEEVERVLHGDKKSRRQSVIDSEQIAVGRLAGKNSKLPSANQEGIPFDS